MSGDLTIVVEPSMGEEQPQDSSRKKIIRTEHTQDGSRHSSTFTPSVRDFFRKMNTYDRGLSNRLVGFLSLVESTNSDVDVVALDDVLRNLIEEEFPINDQLPDAHQVINVGPLRTNRARYEPGDWVEIEGPDMKWRLDMITRVVKRAPDNWDWNDPQNSGHDPDWTFTYNAGGERDIHEDDLRSPEEGLKCVFGCRPWLWQQWAIVKLEEKLRFQNGHEDDFKEFDIQKYGLDLWERWLEHPSNADFKEQFYDPRIGAFGRSELVNHIQKPFYLMDIIKEDDDEWDFDESKDINIFTYTSLLGSGFLIPFIVIMLQIFIPIALALAISVPKKNTPQETCEITQDELYAKCMTLIVLTYYFVTVIPEAYYKFFTVVGGADTEYSRLLSMRTEVYMQADDSIGQLVGYKMDIIMNTAYECMLSMLNIFVLTQTNEALEVLLNALAFIFISEIDEEVAKSSWWDPKKRWICAGAIEIVMQTTFREKLLTSAERFSENFDVSVDDILKACEFDEQLLRNANLAKMDCDDNKYMSKHEQITASCGRLAFEVGNENAQLEYTKSKVYFGYAESILGQYCGSRAVFDRYRKFKTWSRWESVLFLPPIPCLDDLFLLDEINDEYLLSEELKNITPRSKETPFANFYPQDMDLSYKHQFLKQIFKVLTFRFANKRSERWWLEGHYLRYAVQLIGNCGLWLTYMIYIIYPMYLLYSYGATLYILISRECLPAWVAISANTTLQT